MSRSSLKKGFLSCFYDCLFSSLNVECNIEYTRFFLFPFFLSHTHVDSGPFISTTTDHKLKNMARNYRSSNARSLKSPGHSTTSKVEGSDDYPSSPDTQIDPLDSLRSRQRLQKEFSLKDCCRTSKPRIGVVSL